MCAPMMLGAVLSLATTAMSAGAADSAKQQDYQNKAAIWRQNVVNSEAAARDEHRTILNQQLQEQEKTGQKKHVSYLEEAQKSATAETQAASAGVGGISVDNILNDIAGKSQLNRTYADKNYEYIAADTTMKLKASETRLMSRINSVERPVEPASTAGLAIMGGAVKAFGGMGLGG